jgi:C1A family cysteine protease
MKCLNILCISLVAAEDSVVFKRFIDFTHKFEKVYGSIEEFKQRFEIFKNNLIEVLAADDFTGSHTKGITKFSDLTKEEFRAKYLTLKANKLSDWCQPSSKLNKPDFVAAEDSLDWRAKGGVSPVKDQGQCGSCWAFSTIAFLESQSLIKNKKNLTFSEQQLVDCDDLGDQGCNGGLMQTALQYIQAKGIESDASYPYKARDQTCKYDQTKVVSSVSDINCYEGVSNADLQTYLTNVGPLSIAVDADDFQMYDSGVLDCTGDQLDHGVLLVGYTPTYWIIKNSWGKNWGESGFVRVNNQAGQNCAVGAYVATANLK